MKCNVFIKMLVNNLSFYNFFNFTSIGPSFILKQTCFALLIYYLYTKEYSAEYSEPYQLGVPAENTGRVG